MKRFNFASAFFGISGIALVIVTVLFCARSLDTQPVLLSQPRAAAEQAEKFMASVCADDFPSAQALLLGTPELGSGNSRQDGAAGIVWNAFISSISYRFPSECYASDNGVALDMHMRSLNIASVTGSLRERTQALLDERAAAGDKSLIYDAEGSYQEAFVMEALCDAAEQAVREDAEFEERDLTLHFVYQDGQWWIKPEPELLNAISGETAQ